MITPKISIGLFGFLIYIDQSKVNMKKKIFIFTLIELLASSPAKPRAKRWRRRPAPRNFSVVGSSVRFTLIELLVVVAIISILASILLPALKNTREKTREIACVGNLKQFGSANMMYANDNDEWLPLSSTDYKLWDYQLMPYAGYPQDAAIASAKDEYSVFHCPAGKWYSGWTHSKYRRRGYGYNARFCYYLGFTRKLTKIAFPATTILMSDIAYPGTVYNFSERHTFCALSNTMIIDSAGYVDNISYRHGNKTDILFADGHAATRQKGVYVIAHGGWIPQDVKF